MNELPLNDEAIRWGYRWLLGREPEPGVDHGQQTFEQMRRIALNSEEFLRKNPRVPALDGTEGPMPIERVTKPKDLERLFTHIGEVWKQLGETEPHWSVLTAEEFKQENLNASRDEFYASGKDVVNTLERTLVRNGIDSSQWKSCLEYGCGVGRITRWLADRYQAVHGVDISKPHLDAASSYLSTQGLTNTKFHQVQSIKDLDSFPKVDLVLTFIVLQHNPPPVIERTIERLLQAINPGGAAFFQVPTFIKGYEFSLDGYMSGEAQLKRMELHPIAQSTVFELIHDTGCRTVEVIEDTCIGAAPKEMSSRFLVSRPK